MPFVISANRLGDGLVVFRAATGDWRENLSDAEILPDAAAAKATLERAQAADAGGGVIDAYSFEVAPAGAGYAPKHLRDRIRAKGPTIAFDTGAWRGGAQEG